MQKAIVIFKELTDTDIPIHPFSVITCLSLFQLSDGEGGVRLRQDGSLMEDHQIKSNQINFIISFFIL